MSFEKEMKVAIEAATTAGKELRSAFLNYQNERAWFALLETADRNSSSEDDKIVEKVLRKMLLQNFPDYGFYGEEMGRTGTEARYEWIVDPTDGTTQKAINVPYFSISIGLCDKPLKKIVLGIVYNPITQEMYQATRGRGALYENISTGQNHKLKVTESNDFKNLIAFTNPNMDVPESIDPAIRILQTLYNHFRIVPVMYSTALDLTRVADGLAAAVVTPRTAPYDHAAGSLLVEEAGGLVVGPDGNNFDAMNRGIVAVNNKKTLEKLEAIGVFDILRKIPRYRS